ncbi:Smr/MutS family protein [Sphingomonas sp. LB-2]|uniref:Smr/MutS family protein n=1 Tax=Sphingomonas caeni TaxID=2984949 RepID=UPI0022318D3A|nr:Smr/MutS family protein [Sphingomonas caeni]MCW3849385.1 Smr/MutS family protein [Sphingomonas caeni]
MTRRKLAPEEAALWERVIATVTPMAKPVAVPAAEPKAFPGEGRGPVASAPKPDPGFRRGTAGAAPKPVPTKSPGNTLDGSWDKNLSRGLISPESSVDLHGLTLAGAYDRLDRGLAEAIARGDRVLLLVTGKPPRPTSERPYARGAIRAAVGDWLAASRHSSRIAAVRAAHPRHGGTGALYIVLRRAKSIVPKPKS